jgi:hypothetical protein
VAPGAHDLVLRDLSSVALPARLSRFDESFAVLFNSYYVAAGPRHARPQRGILTRPSNAEVAAYRAAVDAAMAELLRDPPAEAVPLIELGLHHEEQHQELLLTDILHALSGNPLRPAYDIGWREPPGAVGAARMLDGPEGVVEIGHAGADLPSTTRRRATAPIWRPSASPTGWSETANGSPSWKMAAIATRSSG